MSRFDWSLEFRGAVVHVDGVTGGCADVLVDYTRTLVPVVFDVGFWRFGEPLESCLFRNVSFFANLLNLWSTIQHKDIPEGTRGRNMVKKRYKIGQRSC